MVLLTAGAIAIFGVLYAIDRHLSLAAAPRGAFELSPEHITDAIATLSSMVAAVLGIIITVVSIIVQLSAERFTKVTEMFFRDRTNLTVLGFYVMGCMVGIFVSFTLAADFVPRVAIGFMMGVAVLSFAIMAPYFGYVFAFLEPENIVARIRRQAVRAAYEGTKGRQALGPSQAAVLAGMEQLTDITVNSMNSKDKIIATAGVDGLKDLALRYLDLKAGAQAPWFAVGPRLRQNPDFVSMAPEFVDTLAERRVWVEWKLLRQYQAIYTEALAGMRDITYVVAIDTRYLGEAALGLGDTEATRLSVKFFNSYLRATLNAKDVRTAYNVLNQYRMLAEAALDREQHALAIDIAGYMKYYGHVALRTNQAFVTETVAYDLCALCEHAHAAGSLAEEQLLSTFLEVDQPISDVATQETGLRGVRKAQVKLATYYMVKGQGARAREIFEDMEHERPERLLSIRDELLAVESEDFWEVIDRGTNFDYLPPAQKQALGTFFGWFKPALDDIAPIAPRPGRAKRRTYY